MALSRVVIRLRWLAILGIGVLAGCGGGRETYQVSGKVTYRGAPLPAGVIYFDPDVMKSNDGPQGYAIIKDGAYDTAGPSGMGVAGGPHLARIEGFDGQPGNELPLGKPLFTDFSQSVDLPKSDSTQDFTVPAN